MGNKTWSVVTIAREEPEVIRRFVAWHLDAGVERIFLYFDNPDDPCIDMVSHLDRVTAIPCTQEFWADLGAAPDDRFTMRQNRACLHGYNAAPDGWVLNVDADELVLIEGRSVGEFLAAMPVDCRSVLIRPAEEVQTAETGNGRLFRQPMPKWMAKGVYGDLAPLMVRNKGMVGHSVGKSFVRTGLSGLRGFKLRQHGWKLRKSDLIHDVIAGPKRDAWLLHFFSRGYDDWRRKLDYRLTNVGFRMRMRTALKEARDQGEDALRDIYKRLHSLTDDQLSTLGQGGFVKRLDLNVDEVIARYFPDPPAKP